MRKAFILVTLLTYGRSSSVASDLKCCDFSSAEIEKLNKGEALARLFKTTDRDLAIVGAVKLRRTKEEFLQWFRHVENFKFSPMVAEVAAFQNPPKPIDLSRLTLDEQELKDIRACMPGKCNSKLSAMEINRLKNEVDWKSAEAPQKASSLFREMMHDYVANYLRRGNAVLGRLNDKESASDIADTYRSMIQNFPYLREAFPTVFQQLRDFPGAAPSDSNHFVYWSREKYGFGMKPLLNIIHVSVHKPIPNTVLIISKQIRSTHYFDGSLGVTMLVDAPGGAYLVYVNRSRIDLLRDAGWFKRTLVERAVPGATRKEMIGIRARLEQSMSNNK